MKSVKQSFERTNPYLSIIMKHPLVAHYAHYFLVAQTTYIGSLLPGFGDISSHFAGMKLISIMKE